ncbi:MAG: hypothetical protein ACI3U8_04035 [Candidatus Onthomonas sp.]
MGDRDRIAYSIGAPRGVIPKTCKTGLFFHYIRLNAFCPAQESPERHNRPGHPKEKREKKEEGVRKPLRFRQKEDNIIPIKRDEKTENQLKTKDERF